MFRRSFGLAAAALIVAACGQTGPAPSAGGSPVPGGRIVDGTVSEFKTLQPVLSTETGSSDVWGLIYIGLTRNHPETGEVVGELAEKYEFSPDFLTLKYTLRDNLVWSDGVPFTGEDYKYTGEATMRSKKTIRKGNLENIVGAKEFGDGKADTISGIQVGDGGKTITIRFTNVFCPALDRLSGGGPAGIIPKHHFIKYFDPKDPSKPTIDDNPLNFAPPAAMGPFAFKEHKAGDLVRLIRNERYFKGAPLVHEYVFKLYANSNSTVAALKTGDLTYGSVQLGDYAELLPIDSLKGSRLPSFTNRYIGWMPASARAPWLKSREVRQALWYGLNIDQILEKVLFGLARRPYGHTVPAQKWAYSEDGLNKYPYDPDRAKRLLEQAGARMGSDRIYRWTDGRPMRMQIETSTGDDREAILQIAQEQYGKIGLKIDALVETLPALTERLRPGHADVDGWIIGAVLGTDPDPYTFWHSSQGKGTGLNRVQYSRADQLIEAQRNGPDCSQETRKRLVHEFNKMVNEDAYWTFLYNPDTLVFANKTLQNFDPKPYSRASQWNIEKWWLRR